MSNKSDVLSHVFDPLRLNGVFVSQWEVSSPWAIQGAQESCALLHYMERGNASISIDGEDPIMLHEGDLAVFPSGKGHVIGDSPHSTPLRLESLLPERNAEKFSPVRIGGGGKSGRMLCAGLRFEADSAYPLYRLLPPVLVIRAEQIKSEPLLAHALNGLTSEIGVYNEGRHVVLLRGLELVYVLGMRLALRDSDSLGRFSVALRNPGIGNALLALHENFEHPWTLESLAKHAGMSRSAFAQCFKQLVGETPARYLMRRRLNEGRRLLSTTTLSIDSIAERIGYESAVGLHLAFSNYYGITPGAFRKGNYTKVRNSDSKPRRHAERGPHPIPDYDSTERL